MTTLSPIRTRFALLALALGGLTVANLVGVPAITFLGQAALMDVGGDSQTLAAAANHSALNLGNSLGAVLGGTVIAASFG